MILSSCRQAAELTSKALDAPLGAGERLKLAVHRAACTHCRRYRDQLAQVDRAVAELVSVTGDGEPAGLSDAAKDRLRRAVRAVAADPSAG